MTSSYKSINLYTIFVCVEDANIVRYLALCRKRISEQDERMRDQCKAMFSSHWCAYYMLFSTPTLGLHHWCLFVVLWWRFAAELSLLSGVPPRLYIILEKNANLSASVCVTVNEITGLPTKFKPLLLRYSSDYRWILKHFSKKHSDSVDHPTHCCFYMMTIVIVLLSVSFNWISSFCVYYIFFYFYNDRYTP